MQAEFFERKLKYSYSFFKLDSTVTTLYFSDSVCDISDLIREAINQLQGLNLVTCNGGRCQFNPSVLVFQADWLTAQVEDPVRAQLALDTLKLGGWPQRLFWQIYRDVTYLDRSQLEQVHRYLANPAITSLEWTDLLQQIRHPKLDTTSGEPIYSEKQFFDFSHQPTWRLPLQLPAETGCALKLAARQPY